MVLFRITHASKSSQSPTYEGVQVHREAIREETLETVELRLRKLRIFGSVCCGEDEEGNDLDLLATIPAEMAGKISLFDIMDF